jgi:transcriptional regulator with XRE-family HTH domain
MSSHPRQLVALRPATPGHRGCKYLQWCRVRELRTARGWTQETLAQRMTAYGWAMHQTTLAKLESGNRPTSVGELAALAAIFEVDLPVMFESGSNAREHGELVALDAQLATILADLRELHEREDKLKAQVQRGAGTQDRTPRPDGEGWR